MVRRGFRGLDGGSESASQSGTGIASILMLMAGKHCVPATLVMVSDGE